MKIFLYCILFFLVSLSFVITPGFSDSFTYNGYITNIEQHLSFQPYGKLGDVLNITVEYDLQNPNSIDIVVFLESWGDMHPTNTNLDYFNSEENWCFRNTSTLWRLTNDVFTLQSDGFGCVINGQVSPIPEPASILLLLSGALIFFGFNIKEQMNI